MTNEELLAELEKPYRWLDKNFTTLLSHATSDNEKKKLLQCYVVARDSYFGAMAKILNSTDPVVLELTDELAATQAKVEQMLQDLKDFAAFLDLLTAGVRLIASITSAGSI